MPASGILTVRTAVPSQPSASYDAVAHAAGRPRRRCCRPASSTTLGSLSPGWVYVAAVGFAVATELAELALRLDVHGEGRRLVELERRRATDGARARLHRRPCSSSRPSATTAPPPTTAPAGGPARRRSIPCGARLSPADANEWRRWAGTGGGGGLIDWHLRLKRHHCTPSRWATSSIRSSGCTTATRTLFAPPAP